jgi:putative tricarboxylic transport membrane protein
MDLLLMCGLGLVGYIARVWDFPIAPVLIGLILGPQAEIQLRRALAVSQGDFAVLVGTPISATLLGIAFLVIVVPPILARLRAARAADFAAAEAD